MRIYGQRAQVPGSIIIDGMLCSLLRVLLYLFTNFKFFVFGLGGSGYCKFGWSKYASPSGRSATFLVR